MDQLKKHKEQSTTCQADQNQSYLQPDHLKRLNKRHLQGALVRSGASLFMWLFALFAFLAGVIKSDHFAGVSTSVAFLILMNPPTLGVLKRITSRSLYKYFSVMINSIEIIGYTVIIYFLGGIEATYLILMYAALIIYIGVVSPQRIMPFIIAGFCALAFILMVLLEHFGLIPYQNIISDFNIPWNSQLMILFMTSGLLFVVAFISSYTANLLKKNRDKLRELNATLEKRVMERTANLTKSNQALQAEIAERKRAEDRIKNINDCFLNFGANSNANIKRLTTLCGELFVATCALYNRLEGGMLCAIGQWQTPPDFNPIDKQDGHICYDVIRKGGSESLLVRNLQDSHYAHTDPNVVAYKLQTYMGKAVKCGNDYVGSLCVVYQDDFFPTDSDKKIMGIIASAIGAEEERRQAKEELQEARDNLKQRVEERTSELVTANKQLKREIKERGQMEMALRTAKEVAEAANHAKSEFLANMSHELRTPLNHIIGFTELVVDKNFGDLNETQEEYLNDVLGSSLHLLSLINDILDLSKVEAGKLELELSDVRLRALLGNSHVMIRETAMRRGIKLSTDVDGIPETIKADERKLKQIIYNLLSNAAKFMPNGGEILLTANLVHSSQLITDRSLEKPYDQNSDAMNDELSAEQKFVQISVKDTGIGLKSEDLERIFDAFEQVESSKSRKYQGTGLGLSLTKRLVELHGGRIWAESEGENKGSTFRFAISV